MTLLFFALLSPDFWLLNRYITLLAPLRGVGPTGRRLRSLVTLSTVEGELARKKEIISRRARRENRVY